MERTKRRRALDDVKKKEICAILSVGCSRRTAAAYVGCAVSTIARTAEYDPSFDAELRHAESRCEVWHMKNINSASEKNWRASAWALERKFPDEYGQRRVGDLSGEQVAQAMAEFATIVSEEITDADQREGLVRRLRALARRFEREWAFERQLLATRLRRKRRKTQ
ncbi:MAG: hypothetical protein R3C10_03705 [Pirellulales bacterium]